MAIKKVNSGTPMGKYPASEFNTLVRTADMVQARGLKSQPALAMPHSDRVVLIKNDTESDLLPYTVLAITGIVITPAQNLDEFKTGPVFLCNLADADATKPVILQEPIKQGEYGRAMVMGLSVVKIDMVDAGHEWAVPTASEPSRLTSGDAGPFRILYVESGTGVKWGCVQFPAGGGTATRRLARIVDSHGSAPPYVYDAVEVVSAADGETTDKVGGVTITAALRAYREGTHPGAAPLAEDTIVEFWSVVDGYWTDALNYPPTF